MASSNNEKYWYVECDFYKNEIEAAYNNIQ